MNISIIIPVYNSEKILPKLIDEIIFQINKNFSTSEYEIILINDFSIDNSWQFIKDLSVKYSVVKGINLLKNYGQHNAIMAGLNVCSGNKIITMDDDYQHPPSSLNDFLKQLDKHDVCYTHYLNRKHNFWKKLLSNVNNLISSFLLNKPLHIYMSSFRGFSKKVLIEVIKYKSNYVYLDGLIIKNAKTIKMIQIEHGKRLSGTSNYNFKKLIILWASMVLSKNILPLRINSLFLLFFKILTKLIVKHEPNKEQYFIIEKTF